MLLPTAGPDFMSPASAVAAIMAPPSTVAIQTDRLMLLSPLVQKDMREPLPILDAQEYHSIQPRGRREDSPILNILFVVPPLGGFARHPKAESRIPVGHDIHSVSWHAGISHVAYWTARDA